MSKIILISTVCVREFAQQAHVPALNSRFAEVPLLPYPDFRETQEEHNLWEGSHNVSDYDQKLGVAVKWRHTRPPKYRFRT